MTKQTFNPSVPEDLNRPYNVTLTEGQIATILYVMEGYIQGNDEYEDSFKVDVDNIFEVLEGAVDSFYESQRPDLGEDTTYGECVDTLVEKLETAKRVAGVEVTNRFLSALDDDPYKNIPNRY
tara:strand:- start:3801 stop:4169 length:369 start_codon:yes stop_codon:yes gene_type:complete